MLREIYIKNVAVIEDVHIEFKEGLNVLTGETGAGKSIIIDSINMILGERTSRDFVRHNSDKARVQAVFDANASTISLCEELGAESEDGTVILSRDLTADGKSTARVNGVVVPLASMKAVAGSLVNIHGQHDNQALLSPSCHIDFLDEYAKNSELLEKYSVIFKALKEVKAKIRELSQGEREKTERADLLSFQIEEIDGAELTEGEEEELISVRDEILNAEKISDSAKYAYNLLYNSDGAGCAYDAISSAISALEGVMAYSSVLSEVSTALQEAKYTIEDAAHSIHDYSDTVEFDKAALDETEMRLELINKLKRKYGGDISKILKYRDSAAEELSLISDIDGAIDKLTDEEKHLESEMMDVAKKLTESRTKAAVEINEKITSALHELNMEQAEFSVQITTDDPSPKGVDSVQFLIRTNGGEPLKPLTKIASGGELSRTMLALKSILSDGVETMIFDEIDTGVSGMAAKKIAVKLFEISYNRQVLCITHLPQLASMCDHHFLIQKDTADNVAKTTVSELDEGGRIFEVARLSGGDVTEASTVHARELLDGCREYKRRKRV